MLSKIYHHPIFRKNISALMLAILCTACFTVISSSLEAVKCGKTKETANYEGAAWNEIYFDTEGFNFKAFIPNYSGSALNNNLMSLKGTINENVAYIVITSENPNFKTPKSKQEFVNMVQEANPTATVCLVDPKKQNAKFVVDLIPKNPSEIIFWRFLAVKNRLVKMGTNDTNEIRRQYFFDSLKIN